MTPMARTSEPRNDQSEPGQDKKTILVVDDDPAVLKCTVALLADHNYRILTSTNGTEALLESRAYKGEIRLLLSDFQMPGMSGVELATAITAERPAIRVLLMSGFPGGMLVLNEGWHFLTKPFVASQLRALVAGLVSPEKASRFAE